MRAIETADDYFNNQDYINAKQAYQLAKKLKPEEDYPVEQFEKTMELLRAKLEVSGIYTGIISEADDLFDSGQLAEAMETYKRALEVMPDEKYPENKIIEIDNRLNENRIKYEKYSASIRTADQMLNKLQYEGAKLEYQNALRYMPDESYPKEKIKEIDNILYEIDLQESSFKMAVQNAEFFLRKNDLQSALKEFERAREFYPDNEQVKETIEEINTILTKNESFNTLIEEADELYIIRDYQGAIVKYREAVAIDTSKTYPAEMITKIEETLLNKATSDQQDYDLAIENGNEHLDSSDYKLAKGQFEFASRIKPDEAYPKEKIQEIETLILSYDVLIKEGDTHLGNKDYENAKSSYEAALLIMPRESYPSDKIDEINIVIQRLADEESLLQNYEVIITEADEYYSLENYEEARTKYQEALSLLPTETYPETRITEIDAMLQQLEEQKAIETRYNNLVEEGDRLFQLEDYAGAKRKYQEAHLLKLEETYAFERVEEIDRMVADMAAYKAKQENYNNIITSADELFIQQDLDNAKAEYLQALEVFPLEKYPQQKIAEADSLLSEIERLKQLELDYQQAIKKADELLTSELYKEAKAEYLIALDLKPGESYPQAKINGIDEVLAEITRQEEIQNEYERLVANAERLFEEAKYEESKSGFQQAREIKPDEQYPTRKISEINAIQLRLEKEKQEAYDYAITKGDNLFNGENYEDAKEAFMTASNLMPEEIYPKEKIDECNGFIAEIKLARQKAYDQAIADADKFYNSKVYDKAIESYLKAEEILPEESYPRDMINKITKMIRDNLLVDINQEYVLLNDGLEERFDFNAIPIQNRKDNYILIKARNVSGNEFKVIFSYGSGDAKNGGSLLRIPAGQTGQDYLIRIGTQYKWFSEDNDWVSLVPEGGDIEVSLIRVSKGD